MRVGVEVGGTFTDLILLDDSGGVIATTKVLSTPANPALAVVSALDKVIDPASPPPMMIHGSTVATNAVLERKGVRTGFLTTSGFTDILELQRQDRERIYELQYRKPEPLVPGHLTRGVHERIAAGGEILTPLDTSQAIEAIESLVDEGVNAIAVCFLHSYAHPEHEQWIAEAIEERYPGIYLSLSSSVVAEFREYERASTTVIDAYVKPIVRAYLEDLETQAGARGISSVMMMQSNGGLLPARYVREQPGRTLFSGPAAGVTGAIQIASEAGIDDIITMDMGGTSTDVCLVTGGRPQLTTNATIARLPMHVPMIDIETVGAGGGSIAWLDPGGMLQVGPRSAGADPGPACYGFGGTSATTTDANVVRGLIRPGHFLGGELDLDVGAARQAVAQVADQLGQTAERTAENIARIADVTMANALRLVSTERGHDPRRYTLVAYGGAGPLHAAGVADQLNIDRVLVPPYPGLLSAFGLLAGRFQRDFARTRVSALDEEGYRGIEETFDSLRATAHEETAAFGIPPDSCSESVAVDMRYRGQGFELTLDLDLDEIRNQTADLLAQRFHDLHRRRYGHATPHEPVELVTYRLTLSQEVGAQVRLRVQTTDTTEAAESEIVIDGRPAACRFHWRASLEPGFTGDGPLVVEEPTATTYVPPDWHLVVDSNTNLLIERKGAT
ncbi:MAG: hydantoinase/oxoprolinase family protein [Thermomicrobiales bacterium]